jgi:hypothetical protein
MLFRTASFQLAHGFMSAQDARGPEDEDHERAWRPAVRQDYPVFP